MATGWVKSLHCKSRAVEDVLLTNTKNLHHLIHSSSCRKSVQSVKDAIETTKSKTRKHKQASSRCPRPEKHEPGPIHTNQIRVNASSRPIRTAEPLFPALTELPDGHPSRNVVEIIFHTSWSPKEFSVRVEMVFKVQNGPRTVKRFEEYREMVKNRAGSCSTRATTEADLARCVADGNEVMRFHCLGPTAGGIYDAGGLCGFAGGKGKWFCTFSGSGAAHESGGGGRGRRAMLVCRVIAGRVAKRVGVNSFLEGRVGFDSLSGDNGDSIVFDTRAVLPCFLIIYKL